MTLTDTRRCIQQLWMKISITSAPLLSNPPLDEMSIKIIMFPRTICNKILQSRARLDLSNLYIPIYWISILTRFVTTRKTIFSLIFTKVQNYIKRNNNKKRPKLSNSHIPPPNAKRPPLHIQICNQNLTYYNNN